jgi:bifunctional non-homologous end joining protein LigD
MHLRLRERQHILPSRVVPLDCPVLIGPTCREGVGSASQRLAFDTPTTLRGDWSVPGPANQPVVPAWATPMLAKAGPLPASDTGWAFEFKWDGVRAISAVESGRIRAMSRGEKDLTAAFPELSEVAAQLGGRDAVLDGELVAFDAAGRPSFGRLQRRLNLTSPAVIASRAEEVPVTYLVFDLLALDGGSLLDAPYDERRSQLESLGLSGDSVATPPVFREVRGSEVLAAAAAAGLEGVVAKRRDSRYRPGERATSWVKIKIIKTQEVVLGGWTDGEGERAGSLGALALGVYDAGALVYAGKVGTGFDATTRRDLLAALRPLGVTDSPFDAESGPGRGDHVHFVRPELVGEVSYGEWTDGGHLRHPTWRGLRLDKIATQVVRES